PFAVNWIPVTRNLTFSGYVEQFQQRQAVVKRRATQAAGLSLRSAAMRTRNRSNLAVRMALRGRH
ncbi:MAG: hypothetical protein OXD38_09925, partial [Aestuariivita sp.]|nr:hypothetical protein [Aestuariivita sp.]